MITPANFKQTVCAVKHVASYRQENGTFKASSLALKLGQSLTNISELFESKALVKMVRRLPKQPETSARYFPQSGTHWN